MKRIVLSLGLLIVLAAGVIAQPAGAPVYVTLWFDAEDYILPQDDDATKRLAELLTQLGVQGHVQSCRREGSRARASWPARRDRGAEAPRYRLPLEHAQPAADRRGVPAERRLGGGRAEFLRRESSGARDLQRIFGVTPIGVREPGSAGRLRPIRRCGTWGSHGPGRTDHVGIDDLPFYYGGMLNVFRMRSNLAAWN